MSAIHFAKLGSEIYCLQKIDYRPRQPTNNQPPPNGLWLIKRSLSFCVKDDSRYIEYAAPKHFVSFKTFRCNSTVSLLTSNYYWQT